MKKLGIKPGHRVALLAAPKDFAQTTLGDLPEKVTVTTGLTAGKRFDVVVLFVTKAAEILARYEQVAARLADAGGFWIAWPKKSAKIPTDVSDAVVREIGLAGGLVDNKVCAIDEVWSGLRFVRRVKDRG